MEKKKLGLSGKSKLELSKTVGSGTVKQSFSHGRVKSVAVEVKKIRTFRKNNGDAKPVNEDLLEDKQSKNIAISENKIEDNNNSVNKEESNETNKDRLQKLKENAQSDRIARENKISSTEKTNKIEKPQEKRTDLLKKKDT